MSTKVIKKLSDFGNFEYLFNIDEFTLHPFIEAIKKADYESINRYLKTEDEETLHDGIVFACHYNNPGVAVHLMRNGANFSLRKKDDCYHSLKWNEILTVTGYAISYRQTDVVKELLKNGMSIDDVTHENPTINCALNIYYDKYDYKSDIDFLKLLLESKASTKLPQGALFMIGTKGTSAELKLLLDHKLDPKSVLTTTVLLDEARTKTEINLLDIAIHNSNNHNEDSINKVKLLLDYGANHSNTNNDCRQNYLHMSTDPDVISMLLKKGCNVNQTALFDHAYDEKVKPIDVAIDPKIKKLLSEFGATPSELSEEEKKIITVDLFKHVPVYGIKNLIYNITNNQDIISQQSNTGGWTILHYLFAGFNCGSVSDIYDFEELATNMTLKMINILIKAGAKPIKDRYGRTPLMCMTHHPHATKMVGHVINMYSDFEADYHKLPREEYAEKIIVLRKGGFMSVTRDFGLSIQSEPIKKVFDEFWSSFKNKTTFKPKQSRDPIALWNSGIF